MTDFRTKFTKWYYRKGYRMYWTPCDYGDGVGSMNFVCPWWVRIFVGLFFSPSVYYYEVGYEVRNEIMEGFTNV
jgi:hypothetical protein